MGCCCCWDDVGWVMVGKAKAFELLNVVIEFELIKELFLVSVKVFDFLISLLVLLKFVVEESNTEVDRFNVETNGGVSCC